MLKENPRSPKDKEQAKTMRASKEIETGKGERKDSRVKRGLRSIDAGNTRFIYVNTSSQPSEKTRLCIQIFFMSLVTCVNTACIVIGYKSIGLCPIVPEIPYYLLIKGAVGLADIPSFVLQQLVLKKNPGPWVLSVYMMRTALFTANFAILIYGSIKVYSIYEPKYEGAEYCDELCYKMSFTVLTFMWCSLGLALCCCCCAIPFYCMFLQATYGHSRHASIDQGNLPPANKN